MTDTEWYHRTLRWGQTNLVEIDPTRFDGEQWRAYWRRTSTQGVIVNAGGIVAYYPSAYPQHRGVGVEQRDLYGEIVSLARAEGLTVIARMDSNRIEESLYREHPEWVSRDAEGEPYRAAGRYVTCIHGPYYREFLPAVMREIIERSDPDGFADNSWAGLPRSSICYCDNCREGFAAAHSRSLPPRADWDDPAYRDWIRWNYDRRVSLWDENNAAVTFDGREDRAWAGMVSGNPLENSERFIDIRRIVGRARLLMLDHQRRNEVDGFPQNTEVGLRLHELGAQGLVIPESMPMYELGSPAFRLAAMPAAEVRLWATHGFAGGIQPWWHHIGSVHEDARQYETAPAIFAWHEENQDLLVDRQVVADVAVVWSQLNNDVFGREDAAERAFGPYRGMVQALQHEGIPFVPVNADDLAAARSRFRVLVLPDLAVLTDEQISAVEEFARDGGAVVATGETGLYDAAGVRRATAPLAPLLGVKTYDGLRGGVGLPNNDMEVSQRHSYLRLHREQDVDGVLSGFAGTDILAFGGQLVETSAADAAVLLTFIPEFPIYPPETAWMREPVTSIPALVVRRATAEHGRIAYVPADIDRCVARDRHPDLMRLIADIVRWAAGDGDLLSTSPRGLTTGVLYRQPSRHVLHLVNAVQTSRVPGRQGDLVAIGPVEVTISGEAAEDVRRVRLAVAGVEADFSVTDGTLRLRVGEVDDHEVIVIEHA